MRQTPVLCIHCGKPITLHGPFARCAGGQTQFTTGTMTIDDQLWKDIRFLIEGIAIMDTLRQSHPQLQEEFRQLAKRLPEGKTR